MRVFMVILLIVLAYGFVGALECDDFDKMTVEVRP